MTERRFKNQQPSNTSERIEAIYGELCSPQHFDRRKPIETLKEHAVALLAHLKEVEQTKTRQVETEKYMTVFSLYVLSFLALIFLLIGWKNNTNDWEWLNNHRFTLKLIGVAFAAVFIGIQIERMPLFKKLWSFGFTKLITSVAISAMLIFCTGKASSLINSVFGVDASVFPFTRAYITGILAFQYCWPLLIVVAIFAIIYAIDFAEFLRSMLPSEERYTSHAPPWESIIFLFFSIIILWFSWHWISRDFSESNFPKKIYRLAHILDFNSKHSCANIQGGVNVVFVGSDHSKVLIDSNIVQTEDVESFIDSEKSDNIVIPKSFLFLACNPANRSSLNLP